MKAIRRTATAPTRTIRASTSLKRVLDNIHIHSRSVILTLYGACLVFGPYLYYNLGSSLRWRERDPFANIGDVISFFERTPSSYVMYGRSFTSLCAPQKTRGVNKGI